MHKRRHILIGVLLLMLVCVVTWLVLRQPRPVYQGKSAGYWMNYDYRAPEPERKFREVWRGLGSNAVPFLVKALDRKEQPLPHFSYASFRSALAPWVRNALPAASPPARVVRSRAAAALGAIGTAAEPAIPALLHTAETDVDPFVRLAASNALKSIDIKPAAKAGFQ